MAVAARRGGVAMGGSAAAGRGAAGAAVGPGATATWCGVVVVRRVVGCAAWSVGGRPTDGVGGRPGRVARRTLHVAGAARAFEDLRLFLDRSGLVLVDVGQVVLVRLPDGFGVANDVAVFVPDVPVIADDALVARMVDVLTPRRRLLAGAGGVGSSVARVGRSGGRLPRTAGSRGHLARVRRGPGRHVAGHVVHARLAGLEALHEVADLELGDARRLAEVAHRVDERARLAQQGRGLRGRTQLPGLAGLAELEEGARAEGQSVEHHRPDRPRGVLAPFVPRDHRLAEVAQGRLLAFTVSVVLRAERLVEHPVVRRDEVAADTAEDVTDARPGLLEVVPVEHVDHAAQALERAQDAVDEEPLQRTTDIVLRPLPRSPQTRVLTLVDRPPRRLLGILDVAFLEAVHAGLVRTVIDDEMRTTHQ